MGAGDAWGTLGRIATRIAHVLLGNITPFRPLEMLILLYDHADADVQARAAARSCIQSLTAIQITPCGIGNLFARHLKQHPDRVLLRRCGACCRITVWCRSLLSVEDLLPARHPHGTNNPDHWKGQGRNISVRI